jgi:hypothetical protein
MFILFWARPGDLMRPCIDTEVADSSCDFTFTKSPTLDDLVWLTDFTRQSYKDSSEYKQYPFTQLGYTYDWNPRNKDHIGLSEFVVRKNSYVKVAGFFPSESFLKMSVSDLISQVTNRTN